MLETPNACGEAATQLNFTSSNFERLSGDFDEVGFFLEFHMKLGFLMVLESWCIASVSFQVFCDLWNECWQFGVTRGVPQVRNSCPSSLHISLLHLSHPYLHYEPLGAPSQALARKFWPSFG